MRQENPFSRCIRKALSKVDVEKDEGVSERSGPVAVETTYNQWVNGMRSAYHPDRVTEEQEKFLGVPAKQLVEVSHRFPHFDERNYSLSVQNLLDSRMVSVESVSNLKQWSSKEHAPKFQTKEIRPGVGRTLPHEATFFLKVTSGEADIPVVLQFEADYNHCCGQFTITGKATDEDLITMLVSGIKKWKRENNIFKGHVVTAAGQFLERSSLTLDDIILNKETQEEIDRYVRPFFALRDVYEANGMQHKRGVILEGPPGTGKTLLARGLANEFSDVSFLWGTAHDLKENMRDIFKWVRELTPAVLCLEDIDFFGMSRPISSRTYREDDSGKAPLPEVTEKASGEDADMGELLAQLDGFEGNDGLLVLATTNYLGALDEALKNRPGRFDVKITLSYPDEVSRERLLKMWTAGIDLRGVDLRKIVARLDRFTPAQIREVVNRTILYSVDKGRLDDSGRAIVTQGCFDAVLESWR